MNSTGSQAKPVYAWVYGSVMALGLPLNAVSLWILLRHHRITSPSVVFMINLAISDLLLTISLPLRIHFYVKGIWTLGVKTCVSALILFCTNIQSSAIFITFISVDRLLAVVYPLRSRYLRTSSNAWKAAALAWVCLFLLSIPHSMGFYNAIEKNSSACFDYRQNETVGMPAMIYFWIVLVFILLVINVVCTSLVCWTLYKHVTDSARINNRVNIILIFVMSFVMFTICVLPVKVVLITKNSTAITLLTCLATVNCCLDPLLYYFSLDAFWKKKEDVELAREQ